MSQLDTVPTKLEEPFVELLLAIADDKLFLGHCNSDWTGLAPILEEDIAFSSIAQDELAHASSLYEVVAGITGSTPDQIAFNRTPEQYRCASIVELNDDFNWAKALARQFFCDHFDLLRLSRLSNSAYTPVADLAGRLVKEEEVHVQHVDRWMKYLGKGTLESHERMQKALDALAPRASMLNEWVEGQTQLAESNLYPGSGAEIWREWTRSMKTVLDEADLRISLEQPDQNVAGGRKGHHDDTFPETLAEMSEVFRIEPNASW